MGALPAHGSRLALRSTRGAVTDFTALGDTVNVAARMQAEAAGGELLIREGLGPESEAGLVRRTLNLRGHEEPIDALVVRP